MRHSNFALLHTVMLAAFWAAPAFAQSEPAADPVKTLVGRLDLVKY